MYRVAARLRDAEAQAVAARYASFGHTNLEEYWTLLWRDPDLPAGADRRAAAAPPLRGQRRRVRAHVVATRTRPRSRSRRARPRDIAWRALLPQVPEWRLSSGHAHPDAGSFIVWARGRYLVGDTGYAGLPSARDHNTLTFGGLGQGIEGQHDVWARVPYEQLDGIRITEASLAGPGVRIVAELAPAYPASSGITRATRTFTFDGARTVRVRDDVEARQPLPAEWRLHADHPFTGAGARHALDMGGVRLEVELLDGETARATTGPALLQSPGRPGSIESGPREPRGHELVWSRPAASRHAFEVILRLP